MSSDPSTEPGGYDPPATEKRQDTSIPAPESERRSRLLLAIALLFVFGPALAFVAGARPHEIENRRLSTFPSPSDGWDFFPELNAWANDHLPLRSRAIKANTSLSEGVFGQTPQYGGSTDGIGVIPQGGKPDGRQYPKVVEGKDGWLFYGGDFQNPCQPVATIDQTMAGLQRFTDILRRSGRQVVFTVAPDKSEMNPDRLPATYLGSDCAPPRRAQLWQRLQSDPPSSYVDLKGPLAALAKTSPEPLWRAHDTHWATRGAAVYVQRVIDAIRPGLWQQDSLVSTGPVHKVGDLSVLLGTPKTDTWAGYAVQRPGVTVTSATTGLLSATSTRAPLIDGALVLGDSFTQASRELLAPFVTRARILHPNTATASPGGLVGAIKGSKVVVLEVVERDVVAGNVAVAHSDFLDQLEAGLR